jgi:hypothetical protein
MTNERFQQIERLIEDAGRIFDPASGVFESIGDEEDVATDMDPLAFLGLLGISEAECAEYVQRKTHDYDESFRDA